MRTSRTKHRSLHVRLAAAAMLLTLALAACGGGGETSEPKTLTVFAAASLQESFTELAEEFEHEHDVKVEFNFGPSSGLAEQIKAGAPADVFASASTTTMQQVTDSSELFAANTMQIAVPPANPGEIEGLAELAWEGVKVALCQEQVPCGAAASEIIEKAGLKITPVTEETDVKAVLTKVRLGEVDAGIVYVTDVKAAGNDVLGIEIPSAQNTSTRYPIVALTKADLGREWVDLVRSQEGQKVLAAHGFSPAN